MAFRAIAAIVLLVALGATAQAEPFTDPQSGISVTLDDSYVVAAEPMTASPDVSMILIMRRDGTHPFVPGSVTPLCALSQWPDPEFAAMSQSEINATATTWPDDIMADFGTTAEIESLAEFNHDGLNGIETVLRLTQSVTAEKYLVIFALATPRGRASISCAAAEGMLETALPVYRQIRDAVTLPQ